MTRDPFSDRRGRVPFAAVGALLLVTSASLAAGIAAHPPVAGYDAGPAVEASWTAAHVAAQRAVLAASVRAARRPVVERADTPYGRTLNASDPFRDALRLRIYVALRRAFGAAAVTAGGVTAAASLPPIHSPADAASAIDRIGLRPAENGSAIRVRVRGVRVVARRSGGAVERVRRTLTVTAPTPVLSVHRRVRTFQRRLGRGPLEGSGLARRVTASLTAVAEARALAQYAGAPVSNVLANRHVALLTNRGVVSLERATFGRADPSARAATRRAAVRVAGTDLSTAARNAGAAAVDGALNRTADGPNGTHGLLASGSTAPIDPQPVPLAPIADDAFAAFVDGHGSPSMSGALDAAYAVDCRLSVRTADGNETATPPPAPAGYRRVRTFRRHVVRDGRRRAVAITVGARLAPTRGVPRPASPSSWLRSTAVRRAIDRRLAASGPPDRSFVVHPDVPAARRRAVYRAVALAHAALRNVTIHARRRAFLDGTPLSSLDGPVNATLGAAQGRPPTVGERAALVARRAYAARVRAAVASRRSTLATVQHALRGLLARRGVPVTPPPVSGPTAPPVRMRVSATPAYLSLARRDPSGGVAYYPLAARNTNLFTVPSGDAADAVLGSLRGGGHRAVPLSTAAATLRAGGRAGVERSRLRSAVGDSLREVRAALEGVLAAHTDLPPPARQRVVAAAFGRWGTPAARGLAVANGSTVGAVATLAGRAGVARPGLLEARLRTAIRARRRAGAFTVSTGAVGPVRSRVRAAVHGAVADAVQRGSERALARSALRLLPRGLPLLPLPGAWYVTVNVWDVAAVGRFGRFAVAAPLGRPGVADGTLRYVRTDAPVAVDVTGDGRAERLGRDRALRFRYHTGVVVVAPPGPPGVGDVGDADERSAGWGRTAPSGKPQLARPPRPGHVDRGNRGSGGDVPP